METLVEEINRNGKLLTGTSQARRHHGLVNELVVTNLEERSSEVKDKHVDTFDSIC